MILQEVFRRVEPDNKTLGQFLGENVFRKLGVGVHMGLSPEEQETLKIVNVEALSPQQVDTCNSSRVKYNQGVTGPGVGSGCWKARCSKASGQVHQLQQGD